MLNLPVSRGGGVPLSFWGGGTPIRSGGRYPYPVQGTPSPRTDLAPDTGYCPWKENTSPHREWTDIENITIPRTSYTGGNKERVKLVNVTTSKTKCTLHLNVLYVSKRKVKLAFLTEPNVLLNTQVKHFAKYMYVIFAKKHKLKQSQTLWVNLDKKTVSYRLIIKPRLNVKCLCKFVVSRSQLTVKKIKLFKFKQVPRFVHFITREIMFHFKEIIWNNRYQGIIIEATK